MMTEKELMKIKGTCIKEECSSCQYHDPHKRYPACGVGTKKYPYDWSPEDIARIIKSGRKVYTGRQVYLAGPIEFAKDKGASWRKKIRPDLEKLGYIVIDPLDHENAPATAKELKECKEHGKWERFDEIVSDIQKRDKKYVLGSDFLIVRWDTTAGQSYGTSDEVRWALDANIPIYTIINGAITDESSWMLYKLRQTRIFDSFSKLLKVLKKRGKE